MKLERILDKSCYWIILLLPFFAILGRGVADSALTLTAILFLLVSVLKTDIKPFKEKWFLFFLAFWSYMIARSFFADDMVLAMKKSVPIIRYALFALCFQHMSREQPGSTKKILCSIAIATAFLSINGYMQHFLGQDFFGSTKMSAGDYGRITSTFSAKPTLASTLLVFSSPLIYYTLHQAIRIKKHIAPSLLFCFFIYFLVFLSGERSAFLQVTIFIFVSAICLSNLKPKFIVLTMLLSALGILMVYSFGARPLIDRQFFSALESIRNFGSDPYGKLWKASISLFLDHFLFGVGPLHFEKYCLPISDFCNYHSHNIYLELLSETGIIGFCLFAASIYKILEPSVQHMKRKQEVLHILSMAITIFILVRFLPFMPYTGLFKNWYAVPIWFVLGWLLHINKIILIKEKI